MSAASGSASRSVGFRQQHLAHAGELGSGIGRALGVLAGDEDIDVAADLRCRAQRLGGLVGKGCVVVLGNEKNGHCRDLPCSEP
jgi:hypothetical protein